jgi:hypothetical protein
MKGESESPSAKLGDASVSELQRERTQWLPAIFFIAVLIMSSAHAQESRELISDTIASSQAAEPWQSDTDCMSPPMLLIPATLGGATTPPMKLIDVARSTCNSPTSLPKPETSVRRSPSSRASTDVPQRLGDPVTGFIDAESTNTSGSPPVVSGPMFTGLAPEFSDPSPPEGDPGAAELSGCERDHACEDHAPPIQAGDSVLPKLKLDVRADVGARAHVSGRVWLGLVVWLVLWLALTCVFVQGFWVFYR